ncbi:MAG: hypothetical protein ACRC3J_09255 [Culicoidibacterales bacterium]
MININLHCCFIELNADTEYLIQEYDLEFKQRKQYAEGTLHAKMFSVEEEKIWEVMQDFVKCDEFNIVVGLNEVTIESK